MTFERQIAGGLKSCISAHGPITKDFISSAAKRIQRSIRGWLIEQGKSSTWEEIASLCEDGTQVWPESETDTQTYFWSNGWVFQPQIEELEAR